MTQTPRITFTSEYPILTPGKNGSFDVDGVMALCVVRKSMNCELLYFAGFERTDNQRHRILLGVATSRDGGKSFVRISNEPILPPIQGQSEIRAAAYVWKVNSHFEMIYGGGDGWTVHNSHQQPTYSLWRIQSKDGINWPGRGQQLKEINDRFIGFGRPWLDYRFGSDPVLNFSVRDLEAGRYRMAYSLIDDEDSVSEIRLGIGLEPDMEVPRQTNTNFAATIRAGGRDWCFYNGDGNGAAGVFLAEWRPND